LLTEGKWFEEGQERRHSRMMWEGLFFFFWHADKMMYQREAAVKIAALIKLLPPKNEDGSAQALGAR